VKAIVATLLAIGLASACGESRISTHRLVRTPYLGLRCPGTSSAACDRVSLAVWLRKPAARLSATVDGMSMRMKKPVTRGGYYEGDASHWEGRHSLRVRVHLVASYADGSAAATTVRVLLHPGWG
jgi:hypothetical protein